MKNKKIPSYIYIFSFIAILGSALLSFEGAKSTQTTTQPNGTPTPTTQASASPDTESLTPTITTTLTPTLTPSPSPSPTPSLSEINASIPIQLATDTIGQELTQAINEYLTNYYSDETLQVKEFSNLTCYYKKGLSYADYIVYACYDVLYNGNNVWIPTLEEFCVSYQNDTLVVYAEPQDELVSEALFLSRASKSVSTLYLKETIRRYMKVQLACDEELLSAMITDASYINMDKLQQQTQYIVDYHNLDYIIRSCPDTVTDFDYIVYLIHDLEFISISTLAPGMDEFQVKLDENNYPRIFCGVTSKAADEFILYSHQQEDYLTALEDVVARLETAISNDSKLRDIWNKITSVPNTTE